MDIFVGSLSFKLKESELREAFEKFGKVSSAKIIIDKITRQSKGFGFVEMPDESEARTAISSLNGAEMYGRALVVNESQKREPRQDGGSSAPRGDFKREGFSRPRSTEGGDYRPSTPSTSANSDGESRGGSSDDRDSGTSSSGGSGFSYEKPKPDRRFSSGGHSNDRNNSNSYSNKPKSDNRFGKNTEQHRRGGGGSKSNWGRTTDDDDDRW
ncbi:RNA recognition motif domain-containing protein [Dyadobacter luticola]|uniref:RNA-binding protein n=1 Tax=Dyadobacter luticola TaxID=1979387 RepID=A0A5R9KSB3_9BACT|nr:RNA-binding protein [Dyadobacter luticola]TLU98994.1 RNA-binding protein [Dyadobacter luticola]